MSKRSHMLSIQSTLAAIVVITNISLTIWATGAHKPEQGTGTLWTGNCSQISWLNSSTHLLLNILSSLFLGAGNYCTQILVAPSRAEVNRAHAQGRFLDIGTPSLFNLRFIKFQRALICGLIVVVTMVLHVLWVVPLVLHEHLSGLLTMTIAGTPSYSPRYPTPCSP